MSDEGKDNPGQYVLKSDCKGIMGKIESALWGVDGRGGVVKDIGDIKNFISNFVQKESEAKTKGRDWRLLGFAVLGSIITGVIMVAVNYFLK